MSDIDIKNLIDDYLNGMGTEKLATKYHIGKVKVRKILSENNIERKQSGGQRHKVEYLVSDWKIEKYPFVDGFHYVARYKEDGKEFNDYMNQGGFLTSYIKEKNSIEIPTLYDRRKYYMMTGNYWWEQWFDIIKVENKPTKKCPYCDWETEDIDNRSGAFEVHLREKHGITKIEYIKEHPEEREYFALVNETLNRQMSNNEDEYVVCAICGEKFSRIDWRHLKKHGITKNVQSSRSQSMTLTAGRWRSTMIPCPWKSKISVIPVRSGARKQDIRRHRWHPMTSTVRTMSASKAITPEIQKIWSTASSM